MIFNDSDSEISCHLMLVLQLSESSYEAPAPITAPIAGQQPLDQGPPGAPSYGGQQYYNPTQYQQQQPNQAQQPPAAPAAPAPEPPKPVVKAPIPQENQVLKDILEKLTNQCLAGATNPVSNNNLETL